MIEGSSGPTEEESGRTVGIPGEGLKIDSKDRIWEIYMDGNLRDEYMDKERVGHAYRFESFLETRTVSISVKFKCFQHYTVPILNWIRRKFLDLSLCI